jgi:hypothetical protein
MARVPRRIAAVLLAAAVAAGGLGACGGGDDGEEDRRAITAMLRTGLATNDPATLCARTLSAGLLRRVFVGGEEQCLAIQAQAASARRPPESVEVSQVEVDGDRGSARVRLRGGDEDGTRGPVTVVRERGGWRLHDLSTAFLRSEFTAAITSDPSVDRRLRECGARAIAQLDDPSLRRLAFGAMAATPEAQQQVQAIVARCVQGLAAPAPGAGDSV